MNLVCPAGKVAILFDGRGHFDRGPVLALATERLSVVEGFELLEIVAVAFNEIGQLENEIAACTSVHATPG